MVSWGVFFILWFTQWKNSWEHLAREEQKPPNGDWTSWLILGGRGAGKTRAGAEWIRDLVESGAASKIALVGESYENVSKVMIEGLSGLLNVASFGEEPKWISSRHLLEWPNGAKAHCFSAEDEDAIRGHEFDAAWSDELAAWSHGEAVWNNLQLALRKVGPRGGRPRQVITTTPRPIKLLKNIMQRPDTITTRMSTWENKKNLADAFINQIISQYEGTRIGRQELHGEILDDYQGALWTRELLENATLKNNPPLERIIVAVDPPVTAGEKADECGIIIAGVAERENSMPTKSYVLADLSCQGLSPHAWASRVVKAYETYEADGIVVEVNQGGDLVESLLRQIDPLIPISKVRASKGKRARAEPVAALYEQKTVFHVGAMPELEDQMVQFGTEAQKQSPDRVDALVWALTALVLNKRPQKPSIRFI